jgi:hypothetical protein
MYLTFLTTDTYIGMYASLCVHNHGQLCGPCFHMIPNDSQIYKKIKSFHDPDWLICNDEGWVLRSTCGFCGLELKGPGAEANYILH